MSPQGKIIWQHRPPRYDRPFMQPLAVALVCAIFIGLILTMGVMDLRRSDQTLVGFMENQGMRIVGVVERLTQENLNTMIQASQKAGGNVFVPLTEQAISPQKFLTEKIVAMAREVDIHWKTEHLSGNYLRKYAQEKNLWLLAVLNAWGDIAFQSRDLPDEALPGRRAAMKGSRREGTPDLFTRLARQKIGFLALRRPDGSGTIVIALDQDGVRYWGTRVSVEKAIEKLGEGQGQGLVYLTVREKKGMLLGNAGELPEVWGNDHPLVVKIINGTRPMESRKVTFGGKSLLEIVAPFHLNEKIAGIVRLGLERGNTDQILAENRRNMFIFLAFVVLIALLSMWLLYHNQNRHLAGIVEMERQLEKAERLSSLGQLAAGVAHEIRNPLNAISMASQRLKREFLPADQEKMTEFEAMTGVIRDEIRRLNGIIEEFLTFSKSRRLELHDCPVQEILQKIVNLISAEAATKGITLRTDWGSDPVVIPMDMDKLQQAFLNFIKNAMESISGEGTVTISVRKPVDGRVSIRITDTGCGMTSEEVDRIFNPEYTTKEKGLGLGLPLAHEIIRGHGGEIRVLSLKESGTTFEVLLPAERHSNGKGVKSE
ncbi:MAG: ATP-binding protein [Proteobacteria bacterium]|nr:ATP-binding protein [Pseudomonadota bacterium]